MADNNFDILIRILTQQVGSEKASDILKKVSEQTKSANTASVDFSKTQTELEKNVAKTSIATDDLNVKKKDLLKLAHLLPAPIREIGTALKFAFSSPLVAAIAGLLFLINRLVDTLRQAKEKAEALNLARIAIDIKKVGDEAGRAATNWESWDKAIGTVASDTDAALDKTRQLAEAAQQVAAAELELARARVESDPNLSPEQKASRLAGLGASANADKAARAQQLREAEIADTQKKLAVAEGADVKARIPLTTAAYDSAKRLDEIKDLIEKATAGVAKYDELQKAGNLSPSEYGDRNRLFGLKTSAATRLPDLESAAADSAAALTNFDSVAASAPGLRAQLARQTFSNDLRTKTDQTVLSTASAGQTLRERSAAPGGRMLSDAAEGADVIRAGGKATADQKAAIAAAAQSLGLVGQNSATILAMLSRMNDSQEKFATSLSRLEGRVKNRIQSP